MRSSIGALLAIAGGFQLGCSSPPSKSASAPAQQSAAPVRITQFYATQPKLSPGDKELLCYGVENAKTVSLSPGPQELSAALSRCVEVDPKETTTYTLTAQGDSGAPVTKDATVTMGSPRVKIVEVTVSSLTVKAGDAVSLCYNVRWAKSVAISPIGFHGGPSSHGCTMVQPRKTTTYTVSALGPSGDKDEQPVTVKVQ
jgi:hypothetical protein